jgi:3'-phosphoadenosine 5'-phosphosulfate sulfotransferase (PAPS reductase)/FAD synthetase
MLALYGSGSAFPGVHTGEHIRRCQACRKASEEATLARGPVRHVVSFSSGATSWAAAKRVVEEFGADGVVLLFADSLIEDVDNYRFLHQGAANVGAPLVMIADGRDPWRVMTDERFMGTSNRDPCSRVLKRKILKRWRSENAPDAVVHVGLDWTEMHRVEAFVERERRGKGSCPMAEPPYLSKPDVLRWMKTEGLRPPRLYDMGFPHANCGGFCVRAGQGAFALLLSKFPERYREHEREEMRLSRKLGGGYAILRDRRGGESKPMTMRELRKRVEAGEMVDRYDLGGCGCAIDAGE